MSFYIHMSSVRLNSSFMVLALFIICPEVSGQQPRRMIMMVMKKMMTIITTNLLLLVTIITNVFRCHYVPRTILSILYTSLFNSHNNPMIDIRKRLKLRKSIQKLMQCVREPYEIMLLTSFLEVGTETQRS